MTSRDRVSLTLSVVLIALGVVMTIQTLTNEGDGVKLGYILGPALVLAGIGRGWLAWHMAKRRG
jgi:hypothetical protein